MKTLGTSQSSLALNVAYLPLTSPWCCRRASVLRDLAMHRDAGPYIRKSAHDSDYQPPFMLRSTFTSGEARSEIQYSAAVERSNPMIIETLDFTSADSASHLDPVTVDHFPEGNLQCDTTLSATPHSRPGIPRSCCRDILTLFLIETAATCVHEC